MLLALNYDVLGNRLLGFVKRVKVYKVKQARIIKDNLRNARIMKEQAQLKVAKMRKTVQTNIQKATRSQYCLSAMTVQQHLHSVQATGDTRSSALDFIKGLEFLSQFSLCDRPTTPRRNGVSSHWRRFDVEVELAMLTDLNNLLSQNHDIIDESVKNYVNNSVKTAKWKLLAEVIPRSLPVRPALRACLNKAAQEDLKSKLKNYGTKMQIWDLMSKNEHFRSFAKNIL